MRRPLVFTASAFAGDLTMMSDTQNIAYYAPTSVSAAQLTETAIAFHITILDDGAATKYGLNYLDRGFESHGRMRMREKDLMEFFAIVMNGADAKIPVEVNNHVPARNAQSSSCLPGRK